ncbi:MAG: Ig-like domain-containing protein, partial [Draconibacterium sp.]
NPTYTADETTSIDSSMCEADFEATGFTWGGTDWSGTLGTETKDITFTTVNSCDSIVTVNLTVNPTYTALETTPVDTSICEADLPYTYADSTFDAAGSKDIVFTTVNGCDSIVTVNLTVNPTWLASETTPVDTSICEADLPFTYADSTFDAAGSKDIVFTTVNGCDSIVTVNIIVKPTTYGTDTHVACSSFTWIDGITYTEDNNEATYTLENALGCDSIVTLNLTVFDPQDEEITRTVCDSFVLNGLVYYESGVYTQVVTGENGCEAELRLNLTILEDTHETIELTVCDELELNGSIYTESGTYLQSLTNSSGCDSILTINLTVGHTYGAEENILIDTTIGSQDFPFIYGDSVFYTAGVKDVVFKTIYGCDSIVSVIVRSKNTTYAINDINTTYTNTPVSGNVLTNDFDLEGDEQTVTAQTATVEEGTLELGTDGSYVFTPAEGFEGEVVFTYQVCDNGTPVACDNATITITVLPETTGTEENTVTAIDDAIVTEEGEPVSVNVTSNDFDKEGDEFSITDYTQPAEGGTVTVDPNNPGVLIFTPDSGFVGEVTFTYEICDDGEPQACDVAIVTVTVIPDIKDNTTYAIDDAYNGNQGEPITGNLSDNDYDLEGDNQTVNAVPVSDVAHGELTLNEDGSFTYVPEDGYTGPDQFVYEVCDDGEPKACDQATVYITVNPEYVQPYVLSLRDDRLEVMKCMGDSLSLNLLDNDNISLGEGIEITVDNLPLGVHLNLENGDLRITGDESGGKLVEFTYTICLVDYDTCASADVSIYIELDSDCDNHADIDDIDDDNDGILDVDEMDLIDGEYVDRDSDNDGIVDRLDIDSDNDGIVDNIEWQLEDGSYNTPTGVDSDGDGWDDAYDPDNGGTYYVAIDTDDDGTPDYLDLDSDNDEIPDIIEGNDSNHDGIADFDPLGTDSDGDGLDDAYDDVAGSGNVNNPTGARTPLPDEDEDGIRDWRDPANTTGECELIIPEIFSPNGDNNQDYFRIKCIENYPDARIVIYNRWENKVYEKEHYGNTDKWGLTDAWWDGYSEHGWTLGKEQLPEGTYFYILFLNDGVSDPIKGFLFLHR